MSKPESVAELLLDDTVKLPPAIVEPAIFRRESINMLHAPSGEGKTWLSLALAFSISSENSLLGMQSLRSWPTLYIDGEMGRGLLKDRLTKIELASKTGLNMQTFFYYSVDTTAKTTMNLANPEHHKYIIHMCTDYDVIFFDNLNTLSFATTSRMGDVEQWAVVRDCLLELKKLGKCIILIHHSGKSGDQLGTSKRRFDMQTITNIRRSNVKYNSTDLAFEIIYEKYRTNYGESVDPIYVTMKEANNKVWFEHEALKPIWETVLRRKDVKNQTVKSILETYGIPVDFTRMVRDKVWQENESDTEKWLNTESNNNNGNDIDDDRLF